MKIQTIDTTTKKPVANTKLQLQVKGKDSGYVTTTTDATGMITLDDKYSGQQIAVMSNGKPGQWTTAKDNTTLTCTGTTTKTTTTTTQTSGGTTSRG